MVLSDIELAQTMQEDAEKKQANETKKIEVEILIKLYFKKLSN